MRIDCDFSYSANDTLKENRPPYTDEVYDWTIDFASNQGTLEFNARFNPCVEELPMMFRMFLGEREDKPFASEKNSVRFHYKFAYEMEIEIYRREEVEDTSVVSELEEDGEKMYVCFTPTYRQKIWFHILEYKDITLGVTLEQSSEIVETGR